MTETWTVSMPKLGETVTEGVVGNWLKQVGDTVAFDDPLFEVSTDKVDSEIPSPYDGVLLEILVASGETVPVGTPVARIGEPGVWITGLRIQNAGRMLAVEGRSLQAESILRYAGEVNRQFAAQGVRLSSVEMTPVQNADSATAVSFKLY